nr:efflux transporter outer membrane subunit [Bacillota bacterium]
MNRQIVFVLIAIVVLLNGCTLAPKYTRPNTPIPPQWPQGEAYESTRPVPGTATVATVAALGWQEFFTDERLQNVIETALNNNRDLRLAALNVEQARAMYGVQRAELLPSINAVGAGSKQRASSDFTMPGAPRTTRRYSVDLGITAWEIDFFGRIRSLEKQALEQYLATEEARRSAQIAIVNEVSRVYLALAADREKLKLAQSTLEIQQNIYDLVHSQYQVGLATKIDLRRAQTQVDVARGDVARYTQLVAQDRNALNLLAGTTVPEGLLPSDLASVSPPKAISAGLSSEVLLHRPDIMAAEHQLKAANAFIGAARAAFFPRISLTTALGTASDELSDLFKSGKDTWSYAGQAVMPIFDARTWAALRVSKARRKIILAQYEKAIQAAFREVADALALRGTIDQQLSAQQSLVDAVAETYHLCLERYNSGVDSYLSVLDAQRSLYAAQQGLISLRLAKLASKVQLYAVLGGGGGQTNERSGGSQPRANSDLKS